MMSGTAPFLIDGVYSCTMSGTVFNPFNSMMLILAQSEFVYFWKKKTKFYGTRWSNVYDRIVKRLSPVCFYVLTNARSFTSNNVSWHDSTLKSLFIDLDVILSGRPMCFKFMHWFNEIYFSVALMHFCLRSDEKIMKIVYSVTKLSKSLRLMSRPWLFFFSLLPVHSILGSRHFIPNKMVSAMLL